MDLATGQVIFHFGPCHGTNNIGEFLAIVHALALMEQKGIRKTIYSDSSTAQCWVRKCKAKTTLAPSPQTEHLLQLVARAERWLQSHAFRVPVIDWQTKEWGEIPADFGRK